jgi:hypothetical protein
MIDRDYEDSIEIINWNNDTVQEFEAEQLQNEFDYLEGKLVFQGCNFHSGQCISTQKSRPL